MHPLIWGTLVHDLLLLFAQEYPEQPDEQRKINMSAMIYHLFRELACPHCKAHACAYLAKYPVDVHSKQGLLQWIVTFHNHLNRRQKKRGNWSVDEALQSLKQRYHMHDIDALDQANRKRQEDHAHIAKLQKEVIQLKKHISNLPSGEVPLLDKDIGLFATELNEDADKTEEEMDTHVENCLFKTEIRSDADQFVLQVMVGVCIIVLLLLILCMCLRFHSA